MLKCIALAALKVSFHIPHIPTSDDIYTCWELPARLFHDKSTQKWTYNIILFCKITENSDNK